MTAATRKPFTGRHMLAIMIAFFGVVIAVNFAMATLASATFSGVVVRNSYVASQQFNQWLDHAKAAEALGWQAAAVREADGRVAVSLKGVPAGAQVRADAWHPLGQRADRALSFVRAADGRFISAAPLPAGRWTIRIEVSAGGRSWRTEEPIS
ncbi:MAG: FixH family protein [Pseudomonadota bacterium]